MRHIVSDMAVGVAGGGEINMKMPSELCMSTVRSCIPFELTTRKMNPI